jgi:hypothetical protein
VVLEMMLDITMLIYAVSLEFQSPTSIIIHNRCLKIELISLVYFSNGAVYPKLFGQQIDIGTAMRVCFEMNTTQDEFEGALLFKLQKNLHEQYKTDTLSANKKETKDVCMLVAWKMKDAKPFVHVALVECAKEFVLNEDKLKKLYDKNRDQLKKYEDTISDTWFMDDNVVLKTTVNVIDLKRALELSVSISEERDEYAIRPLRADLER